MKFSTLIRAALRNVLARLPSVSSYVDDSYPMRELSECGDFVKWESAGVKQSWEIFFPRLRADSCRFDDRNTRTLRISIASSTGVREVEADVLGRSLGVDASDSDAFVFWGSTRSFARDWHRVAACVYDFREWDRATKAWSFRVGDLRLFRERPQFRSMFWWHPKPENSANENAVAA